nr:hypothetical protein GCM10020092_026080 [Actinoplanes digitatis]
MSRRTNVLACLVTSTLLSLVIAAPAAAAAAAVSDWDYVALGDSYSSGVGASGQTGLCLRSSNAYPGLWNTANSPKTYRSNACSGATTATLRSGQLSGLNAETDLVTLTIGGNDIGFADTVITCTLASDSGCASAVADALVKVRDQLPSQAQRHVRRHPGQGTQRQGRRTRLPDPVRRDGRELRRRRHERDQAQVAEQGRRRAQQGDRRALTGGRLHLVERRGRVRSATASAAPTRGCTA